MKTLTKMAVAVGLAACLSTSANAQGFGRGMGGMMGGGLNLLTDKAVQKELKLSDEQVEKATKAATEQREKMTEMRQELQGLDQAERQEKMTAMMKEMATSSKKVTDDLLKPEQKKRYDQLVLQRQGVGAFASEDVQSKLKFTDEQKNKVKDINESMREQMRDLFQPGGDQAENQKKMTALQKETSEKIMAVLTDDQKKSWKDMTGEAFTFTPFQPRRQNNN